ncbi:MAG TPA: plastocyanin/azurin family copper-binding protein [Acidimicrobiia bacterium]
MKKWISMLTIAVVVLGCSSGGGDSGEGGSSETTAAGAPSGGVSDDGTFIVITVSDFSFPTDVDVPAGRSVQWVNESGARHTIVMDTQDGEPADLPELELNPSETVDFSVPAGEWTYFCSIHTSMTGSLSVQG